MSDLLLKGVFVDVAQGELTYDVLARAISLAEKRAGEPLRPCVPPLPEGITYTEACEWLFARGGAAR